MSNKLKKTEGEMKWIKVVDELPREKEPVIIAILNKYCNAPWEYELFSSYYFNKSWRDFGSAWPYQDPEFWMPFPKAPIAPYFGEGQFFEEKEEDYREYII
ncbi:MAG: DUF551 domain-containing protein [Desulfobacteraceae bacterium]|nr:DUF551 domain-containing protein [Desulfobacteraceae bacterium]